MGATKATDSGQGYGSAAASAGDRAAWMTGRVGLMVHWLYPQTRPEHGNGTADFDTAVDTFNLDRFLADFASTGAEWMMFTIGQNTGYYTSPNSILDTLSGPGHTSRRDLVAEMAAGIKKLGKRFVAYLPSEVHFQSDEIKAGFGWNPADQSNFQRRYTDFIREYSLRFGTDLDSWWFDGCYDWNEFNNQTYNWALWAEAARAGNPDAALAFNDGCFYLRKLLPVSPVQDYLSGEIGWLENGQIRLGRETELEGPGSLYLPSGPFVEDTHCRWHGQVPIDCLWMHTDPGPMPPPRFTDSNLQTFIDNCVSVGGAVTLNVGIYQEGHLAQATLKQLSRIKIPG